MFHTICHRETAKRSWRSKYPRISWIASRPAGARNDDPLTARLLATVRTSALTHSLDSLSLPGLTRQSTLEPAPALGVDARVKPGHDKQRYVPFASLH